MVLQKENYQQKIKSLTKSDWKPLLDLIPKIENTEKFGEMKGGEKDKDGFISMPYYETAPVVSKFLEVVNNMPLIIDFNWTSWEEGKKMLRDENFDFDSIDIPTKCKLITAIVRNDRFHEGALVSAFESGVILKILKSIERQIEK